MPLAAPSLCRHPCSQHRCALRGKRPREVGGCTGLPRTGQPGLGCSGLAPPQLLDCCSRLGCSSKNKGTSCAGAWDLSARRLVCFTSSAELDRAFASCLPREGAKQRRASSIRGCCRAADPQPVSCLTLKGVAPRDGMWGDYDPDGYTRALWQGYQAPAWIRAPCSTPGNCCRVFY